MAKKRKEYSTKNLPTPPYPKKVGILFNDNDFYYTLRSFLQTLAVELSYGPCKWEFRPLTKVTIVKKFNKTALAHYTVNQKDFWADPDLRDDYLVITERNVLFDEEVDQFLAQNTWANGEAFFLDMTKKSGDDPVPFKDQEYGYIFAI